MFAMLAQLFAAFSTLFRATEKASSALNNLCEWADESSASFVDEARIKRYASRQDMLAELGITQAQFDEKTAAAIPTATKLKPLTISS
jgi:hypothetical protein